MPMIALCVWLAPALADPPPDRPPEALHPIISEVLYAVPTYEGDANMDGVRDATGDEFIELFNPHDSPINLAGYMLSDRNPEGRGRLEFRFPPVTLEPGQCAVVFNGLNSIWRGPVGDSRRAAPAAHDLFHDAWVFTMRNTSAYVGLSNTADWVLLTAPDGTPIECVAWGRLEPPPPIRADLVLWANDIRGASATRDPATGLMVSHLDLGAAMHRAYSPGLHPWPPPAPEQNDRGDRGESADHTDHAEPDR